MIRWTELLLLAGLALAVAAVVLSPGIGAAAAVVAMLGWAYEHALRAGDLVRLRTTALDLEAVEARANLLTLHAMGFRAPLPPTKH